MPTDDQRPSAECLTEEVVLAFIEGGLQPGEIESVQAHLDQCPSCLELVNAAVHHRDDAAVPGDRVWMTTFGAGQLIGGRYRIERFIGRGGMGEVYLAHDAVLGEPVALKTLLSTISDNTHAICRLLCEARLARRISHPNVCRVHDVGLHEELGRVDERLHFLTMEFIDGQRLGQLVEQSPLEIPLVVAIARQILAGLGAAHAAGVLHRDLKSDNIMVSGEPLGTGAGALRITITDFGLSQTLDGDPGTSRSGHERVGSVSYMAPEQLLGHELSPATDLFAFGVVLFEMLCGELPFPCDGSSKQMAQQRLVQKPVAPSRLRADVPPALDRLVLRCLMEKPEDRCASADEALNQLDEAAATTNRPSAIYIKTDSSGPRRAHDQPSHGAEHDSLDRLAWTRPADTSINDLPLVSVAALFKA
ncbi:MAG TPA: protein kinase [Polyangiaceae bacterium]|nr:protein kinase [Polyangiaceae bacterium]